MILNSKVIITDLEVRVKCVLYGLTLLLDKRYHFLSCNRSTLSCHWESYSSRPLMYVKGLELGCKESDSRC